MKGGGGQQQNASPEMTAFALIAVLFGVILLQWYYHKADIIAFFYNVRYVELTAVYYILDPFYYVFELAGIPVPDPEYFISLGNSLYSNDFNSMSAADFRAGMAKSGWVLVYPGFVLGTLFAVYLGFFKGKSRIRATYTMRTLSNLEASNWPLISPVLDKNLVKDDINKGAWRMADSPVMFAERYNMVKSVYKDGNHIAELDTGKAQVILAMQMGPLWNGLEPLPAYIRALFAIFAAKAENDAKGARVLLNQIAESSKSGKLNFGGTQELLIKHVRSPKVGRAVGPHAYLLTVMASMLSLARTDGVLATSEFLWLKPLDRRLWYMLNCVGRQTPFTEVSGPFGHWIVEKRLRRPLKVPMVAEAVSALDVSLSEIIYNPEG